MIYILKCQKIIGCIYRHPNANLEEFTNKLELLLKFNDQKLETYILGDFNIDCFKYEAHAPTQIYVNMLFNNTFYPIIIKPTRITCHSATLIDHIFTNSQNFEMLSGICPIDISDHLPVFCFVTQIFQKIKIFINMLDYNRFNIEKYLNDVRSTNWQSLIDSEELNITTSNILDSITTMVDCHVPFKQLSKRKQKTREKPWLTKSKMYYIKIKQKLYKLHILEALNLEKKDKYKRYSNILNNIVKNLKRQYLILQFEMNKTNLKTTWKLIENLIKRNTKSQVCPVKIILNNHEFTTKEDIGNQLNIFSVILELN